VLGLVRPAAGSLMAGAIDAIVRSLRQVAAFSFFINLLALTGSLYMMQVYDRVLSSRSGATLLYLTLLATACLATMALLEVVRSRLLVRIGTRLDAQLSEMLFQHGLSSGKHGQALRDLDMVRGFSTGATGLALLDAPWIPVYIALVYVLHPMLGHVAVAGGIALFLLGLWNERSSRQPMAEAGNEIAAGQQFADLSARNAEVVRALGMLPGLTAVWRKRHDLGIGLQGLASDRAGTVAAVAKALRMFLQVASLGVGAWLVINQQASGGVMIASSIIMGRGLAPLESAIGGWGAFLKAREAYLRLLRDFGRANAAAAAMPLPPVKGKLVFEKVNAGPPDSRKLTLAEASFTLEPGTCLGITGPSGAGKSTLVRLAVGVWRPVSGSVRLDGVMVADWTREELGPQIGYLPQDIELFPGTVAQNIARFAQVDPQQVAEAAQLAGAHAMILALPQGYDTPLGPQGENLSGGQRQRIGLARAFYGRPALVVLDEPTSNLDAEGEAAVRQAMDALRSRGSTVIVIAHRPAVLGGTDQMMVVLGGTIASHGPTAEVMAAITRRVVERPGSGAVAAQAGGTPHG